MLRSSGTEEGFSALLPQAYLNIPNIRILQERAAQFAAAYNGTEGFFDPEASVLSEWAGAKLAVPESRSAFSLPGDAELESRVEIPLRWGLYVDVGTAEVLVMWRKMLHGRAAKGEQQRPTRRLAELTQERAALRLQVETEHRRAVTDYEKNLTRPRLLQAATGEGPEKLAAQQDRFGLSVGRSRDVRDAEKDFTDTTPMEAGAVADYRFAAAYKEENLSCVSTNGIQEVSDD